jgi:hypothetical protein
MMYITRKMYLFLEFKGTPLQEERKTGFIISIKIDLNLLAEFMDSTQRIWNTCLRRLMIVRYDTFTIKWL